MATPFDSDGLWAITCYYNPIGYRRRLENYRVFRRKLGVPLITVELAIQTDFQLQPEDADVLVQLRGDHVIWQTERLFNVALQSLPRYCHKVAWIDCDVVFGRADWAARASDLLDQRALVQLFSHIYDLPASAAPDDLAQSVFSAYSFAYVHERGPAIQQEGSPVVRRGRGPGAPGGAWAGRREILEKHGLYDAVILGGGDTAATYAAVGLFDAVLNNWPANPRQQQHYLDWAVPFFQTVNGNIGCVEGNLYHLWHGELSKRYYMKRHQDLKPFYYDPYSDIAVADNGSWRWNTNKPAMHQYVRGYFESREEDG